MQGHLDFAETHLFQVVGMEGRGAEGDAGIQDGKRSGWDANQGAGRDPGTWPCVSL